MRHPHLFLPPAVHWEPYPHQGGGTHAQTWSKTPFEIPPDRPKLKAQAPTCTKRPTKPPSGRSNQNPQAKAYLAMRDELSAGLNMLNTTNLDYFGPHHQAEIFRLKGVFLQVGGSSPGGGAGISALSPPHPPPCRGRPSGRRARSKRIDPPSTPPKKPLQRAI